MGLVSANIGAAIQLLRASSDISTREFKKQKQHMICSIIFCINMSEKTFLVANNWQSSCYKIEDFLNYREQLTWTFAT